MAPFSSHSGDQEYLRIAQLKTAGEVIEASAREAAFLPTLGVLVFGLYQGAADAVFVEESRVERPVPGSPESFNGLLDT